MAAVDCNTSRIENVSLINSKIKHKQLKAKYVHSINIKKGSLLHKIIGLDKIQVNSRHIYSVKNLNKAKIVAESEDGIIEAIEFENRKFAIGVQWHPEDLFDVA